MQNLLLTCCYDNMIETIIGSVKDEKLYYILCDEASDASNKEQLSLWVVNDKGDIYEDFVKLILCKSGLIRKDFYNKVTEM